MSHYHHGHPFAGQPLHDVQHLSHHFGVEGAGGLVKQHDARLHGERPGDGHPLLLAAGELGGVALGLVGKTDLEQQGLGPLLCLLAREPSHLLGGQRDVVQHRQVREEVEGLEHHAHLFPQLVDIPGFGEADAVDHDIAIVDGLQLVEGAQEGGLARAARPHDHHHFPFGHLGADVFQGVHLSAVELLYTGRLDDGISCSAHSSPPDDVPGRGRECR